ncbi:MAG: RluA family pseudouridine synthase [Kiritimatiellia bacterium]
MPLHLAVDISGEGWRLDAWVAAHHPDLSRTRAQELIRTAAILLNGHAVKPNHIVHARDRVSVDLPAPVPVRMEAEDIPLDVLFEDEDLLVILKTAGMVVHPSPGHETGTIVNALLHRCRDLAGIGGELRPGIVHRLDKGTTGLLVVAKNDKALRSLQAQFKNRRVKKTYLALVWGHPKAAELRIKTTLGRDPADRKRMSVQLPVGPQRRVRRAPRGALPRTAWSRWTSSPAAPTRSASTSRM